MTSTIKVDTIQDAAGTYTLNLGSGNSTLPGSLDLSGGGVYLGGTGSANYLDDYEEGTWTPTAAAGTFNSTTQGHYVKIGKLVTIHCYISSISDTTSSTSFVIGGLPFTASSDLDSVVGPVMLRYLDVGITEEMGTACYLPSGVAAIRLYVLSAGGSYQFVSHNEFTSSSIGLRLSIQYLTDS